MLYNTYTHQTTDTRRQIQENVEEKKVLLVKSDNAKVGAVNSYQDVFRCQIYV